MVGDYRLLRELGRGGMGTVWLAERSEGPVRRQVALKLPLVNMPHKMLAQRFERERAILASLDHPYIARLYDAGVSTAGQPYLAMEYVQGEDLSHFCDSRSLSLEQRLALFHQVLEAVQYAHANLVVHRDIKPANILVSQDGQVRLLDFGIAKLLDAPGLPKQAAGPDITQLAGAPLTPDYASPEQFLRQPVSIATDVYSLGVLLYELLSGERPHRGKTSTRAQIEAAALSEHRLLPSAAVTHSGAQRRGAKHRVLVRRLRGDLDNIVLKALKLRPGERYATVNAFAQDLHRWHAGQPVQARADSLGYRATRFVFRHRLGVAAAAAVFFSLFSGLGLAVLLAQEARTQAQTSAASEAFMVGLFDANSSDQADPARAQFTTARELLDLGAKRIPNSLNDEPEAKLRQLTTLVKLYEQLALPEPALALRQELVRLRQQLRP
jgi:serine/threonine-protein kinase